MKKIYGFTDFNGLDGGALELFTNGSENLLMLIPEHGEQEDVVSVYVSKEQLLEMAELIGKKENNKAQEEKSCQM
ncbi:hypothetical protein [Carnobacterium maltaromaticum]|uniref:hypothetical protein n=1 Tax=Carnobacterium maltaromaticum TaxID=2751 RepID=UPI00295E4543|nr:hypothetical protein [Carnobacterium maltaromaticum]